jgi:hypothetical protein
MGTLIEGLDDHEGYVLWRLADGTLTAAWTNDNRRQLTGCVADCEWGRRSHGADPPTDHGEEASPTIACHPGRSLTWDGADCLNSSHVGRGCGGAGRADGRRGG